MSERATTRRAKGLPGNPAWEAMKATRRNLDPNEAVQEVIFLQQQHRELWGDRVPSSPVNVNHILRALTQKRIPFVLTGAHGIASWTGLPRNTLDVDILVKAGRNYNRAVNALRALYPQLEVRTIFGVTGFFPAGQKQSVIDVTYPHRIDLQETLAHPTWTEDKEQGLRYRIPSLEEALANKYGAMLTLSRDPDKRLIDAADFTRMVRHSADPGRHPPDLQRLQALGEMVWPAGGGAEILRLVEQVKAGQTVDLNSLG